MKIVHSVEDVRHELDNRPSSIRVFVPTMGNLHEGHLTLVRMARQHGDLVIVSIFVNRLQFEPHGDFDKYPRTLEEDAKKLEAENVDLLFAPTEKVLYPEEQEFRVTPPPQITQILEGETRPNFFTGVCTVVMKLFWLVQPKVATFGKKDYQQLMTIQWMTSQFNMDTQIVGGETIRGEDGLALSSRNGFLSVDGRKEAAFLYQTLLSVRDKIRGGHFEFDALEQESMQSLTKRGWKPFYIAIRERKRLHKPSAKDQDLVILAAAQLGSVRLIDNLEI